MHPDKIKAGLIDDLKREGFDHVGVATATADARWRDRLQRFIAQGHHGSMGWIAETMERRGDPKTLWPAAQSVVMVAMTYGPDDYDPLAALDEKAHGTISCYAQNRDYHDVIKGRLKQAAGRFAARHGADVKVFVDTAPLMEKPLAEKAGLGWQGKHTNLVSRRLGSWFFLGAILTDYALAADEGETDHCGQCRACLDVCPTDAFPAPYQLDARRCISYLTIEHDGIIDPTLRPKMGNRIYGCDDCLAVCPWNKFAVTARETKLAARTDMISPPLNDLLGLDDAGFRKRFAGSPIKRIGRNRFVRNCLIAAGNSGDRQLSDAVINHLTDPSEQVRATAVWAARRLLDENNVESLRVSLTPNEKSKAVLEEWK
ncbi:MAG: tRNA epoxyqueuosine(34) reductase QueG, partial [Pseudomonadota bacterium]